MTRDFQNQWRWWLVRLLLSWAYASVPEFHNAKEERPDAMAVTVQDLIEAVIKTIPTQTSGDFLS